MQAIHVLTNILGYYADAVLRFRLNFPLDYPESQPVVQFVTDVFHPLIRQDGTFNLSPRFRPWRYTLMVPITCDVLTKCYTGLKSIMFLIFSTTSRLRLKGTRLINSTSLIV